MNAAPSVPLLSHASRCCVSIIALAISLTCAASVRPSKSSAGKSASSTTTEVVATPIDSSQMLADLEYLSSDALLGRYTFSDNLGVAADFLAKQYTALGIEPVGGSYRMPFTVTTKAGGTKPGDTLTLWVEDQEGHSRQIRSAALTTLANGNGEPAYASAVTVADLTRASAKTVRAKVVVAVASPEVLTGAAIETFVKHEPKGIVLVGEGPPPDPKRFAAAWADLPVPVAWIDRPTAQAGMGIRVDDSATLTLPSAIQISMAAPREQVTRDTFNVLAMLPGREHPEQIVILGAHFDHIGTSDVGFGCRAEGNDTICNGADDNGSGTAMVLAVARAYATAGYRPARTLVFAHFAAEELGLYGSRALADHPPSVPPFEGGRVVAMINLDMVGRLNEKGLAIGGISSSDGWMPLLERFGPDPAQLPIVYERSINSRSDHANFYRKQIPVLFFFTGLHGDYHGVGDHMEQINREGMASIGQLVADLTRALADGTELPYAAPRTKHEGEVVRMPGSDERTVERRTGTAQTINP